MAGKKKMKYMGGEFPNELVEEIDRLARRECRNRKQMMEVLIRRSIFLIEGDAHPQSATA
jgi:metal-responsive CopG/Arc/MetJ family transcriptional regulator